MASPLLALPPELRIIIYEAAFTGIDIEIAVDGRILESPLLATNHQIRSESLGIFAATALATTRNIRATVKAFDFNPLTRTLHPFLSFDSAAGAKQSELPLLMATVLHDPDNDTQDARRLTFADFLSGCLAWTVLSSALTGLDAESRAAPHASTESPEILRSAFEIARNHPEWEAHLPSLLAVSRRFAMTLVHDLRAWREHSDLKERF